MSNSDYWQEKFPEMVPFVKPPSMFTVNGIGTMLHGRRDYDPESNSYVKTLCFTFVFVPVFALRAYRVADAPQGWYFIGKVPLSGLARGWNFLMLASIVLGIAGFFWFEHARNPETVAANLIADGDSLAAAGQPGQAAARYKEVALGHTSRARAALDKLGELLDKHLDGAPVREVIGALEVAVDIQRVKERPTNIVEKGLNRPAAAPTPSRRPP